MRWEISGADKETGEDVILWIEAPDRQVAEITAARRNLLIESTVADRKHVTLGRGIRRVITAFLAGILVCFFTLAWRLHWYRSSRTSPGDVAGTGMTKHLETPPDLAVSLKRSFYAAADDPNEAVQIINRDSQPITVVKVLFNGDFEACRAKPWGRDWEAEQPGWPATLSIGESGYAFKTSAGHDPKERVAGWSTYKEVTYEKEIIFVDVYTDRGSFRYKFDR